MIKLAIGNKEKSDGWINIDACFSSNVDCVADLVNLPIKKESCSQIYCSHVLEHVPQANMLSVFKSLFSLLAPGGKIMLSVPDMYIIAKQIVDNPSYVPIGFIYGGQYDQHDYHKCGFTEESLILFLKRVGFINISRVKSFGLFSDFSEHEISLNIEAYK